MGESVPRRSAMAAERHEKITKEAVEQCERIVLEANNPDSHTQIPSDVLREAQLKLARFEHLRYSRILKQHTNLDEVKEAMTPSGQSDELIGKPATKEITLVPKRRSPAEH